MAEQDASDHELLQRMRSGDEAAFIDLYRRRQGSLYRFALQMSGSETVAEDVVQEVFLALIREASGYDPSRGPVAAFLYGMARKQVLRALRRNRGEAIECDPAAADDPLEELARRELIGSVRSAVLALPLHYREAVVLCDLHEMEYADAAAALGCSIGTVRSRVHRGRALLAARLRAPRGPAPAAGIQVVRVPV
jgi:RNA polymerase sigma-70 factor (ECF subfamily)